MRELLYSLFHLVLTPWGIVALAALDSSVVFSVPFALDAALVILVARDPELFWLYPLLVIPASIIGPASTYWVGSKATEEGLGRLVSKNRLARVQRKVHGSRAAALALFGLVPPPFPLMPVVLVAGALGVDARRFLLALLGVRAVRFTATSALAAVYGQRVISWFQSETMKTIVAVFFSLAILAALYSAYRLIRWKLDRKARGSGLTA